MQLFERKVATTVFSGENKRPALGQIPHLMLVCHVYPKVVYSVKKKRQKTRKQG